ncbi:MAG TPA: TlpA disulfide reductase family protein [Acidimicrobiales bacterium]|jgi:cytochrome c biogenesis protein CcmG/thiol:disulfide interchange protein DsbE|nr:TlpA disulfide reductase family protein [Acidimicrobiales bacterium]
MSESASDVDVVVSAPRRHTARWAAITLGVVLLLFVAVLATRKSAADKQAESPLLGKPAPSLTGTGLDGSQVSLAAMHGKWVVVNFMASWCVPCRDEHPELVKFSQRHEAAGDAAVLGVIFDDTEPNVRRFFDQLGGSWPVVSDPGGRTALDFGVRGPPESFLVDPNGFVVWKGIGQVDANGLDKLVTQGKARGA